MKPLVANQKCLMFIAVFLIAFSTQGTSYGLGEVIDLLLPDGGGGGGGGGGGRSGGGGGGGGNNAREDCKVGDILVPGEGCIYPGTDIKFLVLNDGSGQFLSFTGQNALNLRNTTIDGRSYTIIASKRNDGSWEIKEIGDKGEIIISEIMFGSERHLTPPQWIELYNAGTDPVNLAGWTLTVQNLDSPDLTGPVNATITMADDFWGEAPQIMPNETILIVSGDAHKHSQNLSEENIYDLHWREDSRIGMRDTVLSAEGFSLKLTDSNGNLVDEAGNFDGRVLHWQLPYGANRGRNRAGHRVSIIRRYINDVPLDGTQVQGWVSAEKANLTADQQTYYGDVDDISSPGIGPFVGTPTVNCQVGMILVPGQSCAYPGTISEFSVLDNGNARFLFLNSTEFNFRNTNIDGLPYTLVANQRDDGSWQIEEIGFIEKPAAVNPRHRKWILWGQLKAGHGLKHQ